MHTLQADSFSVDMEDVANDVLITPHGFAVEKRSNGLYLLCGADQVELHVKRVQNAGHQVRERRKEGDYVVEIGYGPSISKEGVAEYGRHKDKITAYRYALAAHYGSYEDAKLP